MRVSEVHSRRAVAAAILAVFAGHGSALAQQTRSPPLQIKAGISDPVNTVLAWYTARAAGLYTAQGLDVAILNMHGGSKGAEELQAGRLDSGDLVDLSVRARRILDQNGLSDVAIFASGNLDEYRINDLLRAGAPIDAFGVGAAAVPVVPGFAPGTGDRRSHLRPGTRHGDPLAFRVGAVRGPGPAIAPSSWWASQTTPDDGSVST